MAVLQNFLMVKQSFTSQETVWMGFKMSCGYIWMLWSLSMSATLWQLTNRTLNKMAVAYFLRCNILYLYWNVTEFLLKGPWDLKSILVDVIAWHRRGVKPILEPGISIYIYIYMEIPALTNDGQNHLRIYTSPELSHQGRVTHKYMRQ